MSTHYIYHPDYEPTLVSDKEYEEMLEKGWYDSPAKFPKKEEVHTMTIAELPPYEHGKAPETVLQETAQEFNAHTHGEISETVDFPPSAATANSKTKKSSKKIKE